MEITRAARSAKALRSCADTCRSPIIGADPTRTAAKLYWRMHQLKVKKAYTNTSARHSNLASDMPWDACCTSGRSASNDTARSDAPSTVRMPARIISVLEAKNDALRHRLPITLRSEEKKSELQTL